jgi:hypothetical protein
MDKKEQTQTRRELEEIVLIPFPFEGGIEEVEIPQGFYSLRQNTYAVAK